VDDDIGWGGGEEHSDSYPERRLVPMKLGDAEVYVERVGTLIDVEDSDRIYTAAPGSDVAFEEAMQILRECVRVVGKHITSLGKEAIPSQVSVEFALSLEAKGEAKIIPVLLTGEAKATSGFKVTAVWGKLEGG
jgi:hypothetical protein